MEDAPADYEIALFFVPGNAALDLGEGLLDLGDGGNCGHLLRSVPGLTTPRSEFRRLRVWHGQIGLPYGCPSEWHRVDQPDLRCDLNARGH